MRLSLKGKCSGTPPFLPCPHQFNDPVLFILLGFSNRKLGRQVRLFEACRTKFGASTHFPLSACPTAEDVWTCDLAKTWWSPGLTLTTCTTPGLRLGRASVCSVHPAAFALFCFLTWFLRRHYAPPPTSPRPKENRSDLSVSPASVFHDPPKKTKGTWSLLLTLDKGASLTHFFWDH